MVNKLNKEKIITPPILAVASWWNAWGFEKSLSKRDLCKKDLEYLEIKKVIRKLIKEKITKKFKLNSNCIYLLYFFTIYIPDIIIISDTKTFQVICSSKISAPKITPNIGIK